MEIFFPKNLKVRWYLFLFAAIALIIFGWLWYDRPRVPDLPSPPLKTLAAYHGIELGNFAIIDRLDEEPYTSILTSQFGFVLADNTPNWYFSDGGLRPSSTTYNFKQFDQV